MDSNLEKTLRKRQKDGDCIICGRNIKEFKILEVMTLHHFVLGSVIVCESHIKQRENSE